MRKEPLPKEAKPYMTPFPKGTPLDVVKVKCPVCNELMVPSIIMPNRGLVHFHGFRQCPTCGSTFNFFSEAEKIILERTNKWTLMKP